MVKLAGTFSRFKPFRTLVLGDFMLDSYTTGRVKRISPEAPVPVMEVHRQDSRPGGAGNVVLNLAALGGEVIAAGRIGADSQGEELRRSLALDGVDLRALLIEPGYRTPVKNRLIADSQQLLRVDIETISPLSSDLEEKMIALLSEIIPTVQVVAISDYGKGFLTRRLIQETIEIARLANIPTIVDPKGSDFTKYKGATVLKPNLSEAYAAAKMTASASLDEVAAEILSKANVELLLITRSEAGMSIFDPKGNRNDYPVRSKEVKDVTGAGDTVLAMICLSLANGLDIGSTAQLANIAAGIAIERLGCVQVTLSELAKRLLEWDSETKIFDESHTYALRQVLRGKQYSLLVLEKGEEMSNALFRTISRLANRDSFELIIYVRDSQPDDEFIHLLSSLHEVDYIILQTESLKNLCDEIHPHEVYLMKEDGAVQLNEAKDLLQTLVLSQKTIC